MIARGHERRGFYALRDHVPGTSQRRIEPAPIGRNHSGVPVQVTSCQLSRVTLVMNSGLDILGREHDPLASGDQPGRGRERAIGERRAAASA